MVGADAQTVRHQRFDLLGRCLTVTNRKANIWINSLCIRSKLFDPLPLRCGHPDLCQITRRFQNGHVILPVNRAFPGIVFPVCAEFGIHIRAFHIKTADVAAGRICHCFAYVGDMGAVGPGIVFKVKGREDRGGAAAQVVGSCRRSILIECRLAAVVGMDIHQTGTCIEPLCIDDLTIIRYGGSTHFTETGDLTILYKENCLRDQMILHHQRSIDDRDHA